MHLGYLNAWMLIKALKSKLIIHSHPTGLTQNKQNIKDIAKQKMLNRKKHALIAIAQTFML